jgi:hypothetical protein
MLASPDFTLSFACTGWSLPGGARAQFRLLLKLPIGCRA